MSQSHESLDTDSKILALKTILKSRPASMDVLQHPAAPAVQTVRAQLSVHGTVSSASVTDPV